MVVKGYVIAPGANLRGAHLGRSNLKGVDLTNAGLTGADLEGARLMGARLMSANMKGANLQCADLRYTYMLATNLKGANLMDADLKNANLGDADLGKANLRGADMGEANLRGANLRGADLKGARLMDANLRGAHLMDANLEGAKLPDFQIPQEGELTVWKSCLSGSFLLKLLIPKGAARTASIVGRKCRAASVKTLGIYNNLGRLLDIKQVQTVRPGPASGATYTVGKITRPDSYDPDPRVECTHGIHFYLTFGEAQRSRF